MKAAIRLLIVFTLMIGFVSVASAQIRKIPAAVTDALAQKYPKAEKVEWSDKVSYFLASFESKGDAYTAKFDSKGEWLGSQKLIEENDLPKDVKNGFEKSKYAEWELKEAFRLYLPGDITQYRLFVRKSDLEKRNLIFNEDGKLLKDGMTL